MGKDNANPFAAAEFALRDLIRGIPEVSGLFGDAVETHVFGPCEEGFAAKLESVLASTLGTGIVVAFTGMSGAAERHFRAGFRAELSDEARFRVEIRTSLLLASEHRMSATDLAAAIVGALDCAALGEPFVSGGGVFYAGTDVADFEDMTRVVTLNFTARVVVAPVRE